jgi:hypothetical protein
MYIRLYSGHNRINPLDINPSPESYSFVQVSLYSAQQYISVPFFGQIGSWLMLCGHPVLIPPSLDISNQKPTHPTPHLLFSFLHIHSFFFITYQASNVNTIDRTPLTAIIEPPSLIPVDE